MSATLFDCDHCDTTRNELAALQERVATLEADNAWMRKRVTMPSCERCARNGVSMWGGWPTAHYDLHGFVANVCPYCWKPGDDLDLDHGVRVTVETDFVLHLHGPGGTTTITCSPEQYMDKKPWSMEWVATGEVEGSGPGGGVQCRTSAVHYVLGQMKRSLRP